MATPTAGDALPVATSLNVPRAIHTRSVAQQCGGYNGCMTTIGPALNGFIKGLLLAIIGAVIVFLGNPESVKDLPAWAALITPLAIAVLSSIESKIKDHTGNGLFGVARVR